MVRMTEKYSSGFYDEFKDTAYQSAMIVAPLILEATKAKSVMDIGCGIGAWLKAFQDCGIDDVCGVDGPWVKTEELLIPKDRFIVRELEKSITIDKTADLAISLEVAEHVEKKSADMFVEGLTRIAPVILFSAAIPMQGGVRHVNEQWPDYWEKKFAERGYVAVDYMRRKIWADERVSFFYAQNMVVYVKKEKLADYPLLEASYRTGNDRALSFVHPHMYLSFATKWKSIEPILWKIPFPLVKLGKFFLREKKKID